MSLLLICEIIGLLINTLTADGKYYLHNNENVPQTIQRQLSKKQKTSSQFSLNF